MDSQKSEIFACKIHSESRLSGRNMSCNPNLTDSTKVLLISTIIVYKNALYQRRTFLKNEKYQNQKTQDKTFNFMKKTDA